MQRPFDTLTHILRTLLLAGSVVALSVACAKEEPAVPAAGTPSASSELARPLTDVQVKAQYQNCPGGWYAGPRPGKARFMRDPWLWAVTPEFAKRFCMPEEFVTTDLKGAEAIAFKLLRKNDEENCGFGGNPSACSGQQMLRFEIYVKSDAPLPKQHNGHYFQVARLPSRSLISKTPSEQNARFRFFEANPNTALQPHFIAGQVGIDGMKTDVVAWPIAAMYLETHFGSVFESIDYYAFDASVGFLSNPGVQQSGVNWFAINFSEPDIAKRHGQKTTKGLKQSDFSHTIALPKAFMDKVVEIDRNRRGDLDKLMDKAFRRPSGQ